MRPETIAIVGAGRLGSTLALRLSDAGFKITEIIARDYPRSLAQGRRLSSSVKARTYIARRGTLDATIIWFCMPDSNLAADVLEFARRDMRNKIALHSIEAVRSDALDVI